MGVQMLSDLKQEFYKFFHPVGRKTNPILLDLELRYIFYTMIWPVSFFRFVTFSIFHRVFGKLFHVLRMYGSIRRRDGPQYVNSKKR